MYCSSNVYRFTCASWAHHSVACQACCAAPAGEAHMQRGRQMHTRHPAVHTSTWPVGWFRSPLSAPASRYGCAGPATGASKSETRGLWNTTCRDGSERHTELEGQHAARRATQVKQGRHGAHRAGTWLLREARRRRRQAQAQGPSCPPQARCPARASWALHHRRTPQAGPWWQQASRRTGQHCANVDTGAALPGASDDV